jgi:hypothetical protein
VEWVNRIAAEWALARALPLFAEKRSQQKKLDRSGEWTEISAHQSPFGYRCTTRVRLRIMNQNAERQSGNRRR